MLPSLLAAHSSTAGQLLATTAGPSLLRLAQCFGSRQLSLPCSKRAYSGEAAATTQREDPETRVKKHLKVCRSRYASQLHSACWLCVKAQVPQHALQLSQQLPIAPATRMVAGYDCRLVPAAYSAAEHAR